MKRKYTILILIAVLISTVFLSFKTEGTNTVIKEEHIPELIIVQKYELLYDDVWGSIYHAEKRQCDDTPLVTGSGFRINPTKASEQRVIAISHEMLNSPYRAKLINNPKSSLYKGKIEYGDSVWVESPYEEINGWWIVEDTKNPRYRKSVDFLQTKGDGTLYDSDPLWNGKFEDIKIYRVNTYKELI